MLGRIQRERYARHDATIPIDAIADCVRQGKSLSVETEASTADFTTGLGILLLAQLLSAFMGAYVEDTYEMYGASWTENLFYTHIMSLPMFLPLSGPLRRQYAKLASTPRLDLQRTVMPGKLQEKLLDVLPEALTQTFSGFAESLPRGVILLLINAVTQLACISGVNLLSAKSSAVTVTIVLNIRKLVSFMFSTVIFGHQLSGKMMLGSVLVFGSGALYGWETSWRLPRERRRMEAANGRLEKIK